MEVFDLNRLGKLEEGIFLERLNRFVGKIKINDNIYSCHIADTGRLREILIEGRKILVVKNRKGLKTDYKLISAEMDNNEIVLVNTSIHSKIAFNSIKKGVLGFTPKKIKSEFKFGNSRLDFLIDDNILVELKASNLLINDRCIFPDAPTERGVKHLKELLDAKKKGYKSIILIMGLRDCDCFIPNKNLDKSFSDTFFKVLSEGVKFVGFKIKINKESKKIYINGKMKLCEKTNQI